MDKGESTKAKNLMVLYLGVAMLFVVLGLVSDPYLLFPVPFFLIACGVTWFYSRRKSNASRN